VHRRTTLKVSFKKLNNFLRRTLTAAWIVIFILGGFWLHPASFLVITLILLIGTQYEYYNLVSMTGVVPRKVAGLATGILMYVLSVLIASGLLQMKYFLLLLPVGAFIIIAELYRGEEKPFDSLAHTFFPLFYTALPFSLFPFASFGREGLNTLINSHGLIFSPGVVIGFILLIWANDTGAYLAGISLGRHKLMERISPKKTWEGFIGGIIIALAVAWFLSGFLGVVNRVSWLGISLIVSIIGTYGDLAESMLKRSAGAKDSGSVLPGHGGFLDRFDSTLLSFPLVYLFITLLG
jgi:phosphatidate cytidylyltransferase